MSQHNNAASFKPFAPDTGIRRPLVGVVMVSEILMFCECIISVNKGRDASGSRKIINCRIRAPRRRGATKTTVFNWNYGRFCHPGYFYLLFFNVFGHWPCGRALMRIGGRVCAHMRTYARRYAQVCAHMRRLVMTGPPMILYPDQMRATFNTNMSKNDQTQINKCQQL